MSPMGPEEAERGHLKRLHRSPQGRQESAVYECMNKLCGRGTLRQGQSTDS